MQTYPELEQEQPEVEDSNGMSNVQKALLVALLLGGAGAAGYGGYRMGRNSVVTMEDAQQGARDWLVNHPHRSEILGGTAAAAGGIMGGNAKKPLVKALGDMAMKGTQKGNRFMAETGARFQPLAKKTPLGLYALLGAGALGVPAYMASEGKLQ